jgi:hypothetical protein
VFVVAEGKPLSFSIGGGGLVAVKHALGAHASPLLVFISRASEESRYSLSGAAWHQMSSPDSRLSCAISIRFAIHVLFPKKIVEQESFAGNTPP